MCGVAAVVRLNGRPVDPTDLRRLCSAIAQRGPDGAGLSGRSCDRDQTFPDETAAAGLLWPHRRSRRGRRRGQAEGRKP
jgi:hypothetical protein